MCESAGIYNSNTDMCLSLSIYLVFRIYMCVYIYIQYVQDMLSDINQPTWKNSTIASSFSSWKDKKLSFYQDKTLIEQVGSKSAWWNVHHPQDSAIGPSNSEG